jgi:hypothetical protein
MNAKKSDEAIPLKVLKMAIVMVNAADQCDQAGQWDRDHRRACRHILDWYNSNDYKITCDKAGAKGAPLEVNEAQDLIERRAALTALCEDCLQKYEGICPHPASRCVEFRTIKQLPAIDAEPERHGRWSEPDSGTIGKYRDDGCVAYYICSRCKEISKSDYDFCPNCGARMDATDTNVGGKGGADNG